MQLTDQPKVVLTHETLTIQGVPYSYVPIKVIEDTLNEFFALYQTEIINFLVTEKNVTIVKRLIVSYMCDRTDDYKFVPLPEPASHDGIASIEITPEVPLPLAISICNSIALKNAAENFGVVFGRDLNRVDVDLINKKIPADNRITKEYLAAVAANDTDKMKEFEAKYIFKNNAQKTD